jgi:hypothetical protein
LARRGEDAEVAMDVGACRVAVDENDRSPELREVYGKVRCDEALAGASTPAAHRDDFLRAGRLAGRRLVNVGVGREGH